MRINNWRTQPLKELCTRIGDGLHGTPKYSESSDIPFINGNNLKNGQILVTNNTNYVTEEEFERNFIKLDYNSLLLSINGTLGNMAFYNDEFVMLGKSAAYLNFKTDINTFYYYYFQLPGIQTYFYNVATGSTIKNLSLKSIQDFEVPVPNKNEYQAIAKVLSDLDTKIELNNKINTELEAMAKLIYDYWFVQFDFPDKNGKPYKCFGGKMVYNEELKREIPEGWEVGTLLDVANFQNGLACQKYRPINNDFLRVIKIKDMKEGFSEKTEKVRSDVPDKIKIFNGDILFSWSASLEVIQWSGGKGALNQHIFKVTSEKYPKSYYYFELLNYLQHFKMMAELRKTTMGHITQEHLKQSRIVIPPETKINQLNRVINPILEKVNIKKIENQKLAELRDWLLPMLMNGQVRVN
jgi:type I restriction enzyme, S subunit